MSQIRLQQLFYCLGGILSLHVAINLLTESGVRSEPATCEHVIALHALVLFANRDFRGDQPDIADVVLRAGMMAAGQMDIERRVDPNLRVAPIADLGGVALGI